MHQATMDFHTEGRGTRAITAEINRAVGEADVDVGLCHVFCQHTSASLILCENADPSVRRDLERFAADWVPDGDLRFEHDTEGPDDMPAHIRTVFSHSGLTLPINGGRLALGTWQGVFLWEHRHRGHHRRIVVTVMP